MPSSTRPPGSCARQRRSELAEIPRAREFDVIERFFARATSDPTVLVGIGDDAAIVDSPGCLAVAVDTLVCGTHFPESLPARAVGHRALAVNLSDLAACAARPRYATLALTLPGIDETWIGAFVDGFFALADRFGVSLIGGDTTHGPLTVTVQVIGDSGPKALRRSGGRVGDRIYVSGTLGDSAAGLDCFAARSHAESDDADALIERFCYPEPRVDLGLALGDVAHAAIDISDGLVADLGHICTASGCGAAIDLSALPISHSMSRLLPADRCRDLALHGGDDYELCFCIAPEDAIGAERAAAEAHTPITAIGELTSEAGIVGRQSGSVETLTPKGFTHFD